jgi:branched-chain amino acid transport system permease protein
MGRPATSNAWRANTPVILAALVVDALAVWVASDHCDAYTRNLLLSMAIVALMAASLALVNGVAGQFSLGHAAFQGVGAYVAAIGFALVFSNNSGSFRSPDPLTDRLPWVYGLGAWAAIGLGAIAAAGVGWLVALPCLRLKGDYLAIVTLGFNEIVGVVIRAQGAIGRVDPGGPRGFNDIPRGLAGGPAEILLALLVALVLLDRIVRSRRGLAFEAVREDEVAAEAIGINTTRTKVRAFVISSFVAGLAGGLYAFKNAALSDRAFDIVHSIDYVLMVILGGGRIWGAAVAGMALTALNDQLRQLEQWRMVAYGFLLVWIMVARAQGLASWSWSRLIGRPAANDHEPDPTPTVGPLPAVGRRPRLALSGVTVVFGGLRAVEGLDLEVGPGEAVGLIGPNGAGKSTVFNVITGIYRPTSGRITVDTKLINGRFPHEIVRHGLARTFQNIRLFPGMSVLDNVRAALAARPESAGGGLGLLLRTTRHFEAEARLDIEARALLDAFGLGGIAGRDAGRLPYGTRRRLEITRALATGAGLLLLDEPAAGLNPSEKDDLIALLRSVRAATGAGLVLIEHDMGVVNRLCPRIIVLDHGRRIAEGPPAAIRDDPVVIEAYLGPDDANGLEPGP